MTDYRNLTDWAKALVDKEILERIEPGHHINKNNGYEWDEPEHTLHQVHAGDVCANCFMIFYNCLCSHDD